MKRKAARQVTALATDQSTDMAKTPVSTGPVAAPVAASAALNLDGRVAQPSRDAGAFRGTLRTWHGPQLHNRRDERVERTTLQRRTDDLFVNDWAARSGIDVIANNAIGTGLTPQSRPSAEMLGISLEEARLLARNMEHIWALWAQKAHYSGMLHFADLQYLGMRTLLKSGEMLHIPVMLSDKERLSRGRTFSLYIQYIAPQRLMTPSDLETAPHVHDGVHLSPTGLPLGYYVALPSYGAAAGTLSSSTAAPVSTDCAYISTRKGHRPQIFHIFRHDTDEQVRAYNFECLGHL